MTIDEGAFQGEAFFFKAVVPVLMRRWSSAAIVTTPQGTDNYVSKMANIENKKKKLFEMDKDGHCVMKEMAFDDVGVINTMHLGLPCGDCEACESGQRDKCERQALPPWKSRSRQKKFTEILMEGRTDDNLREQFGVITNENSSAFTEESVNKLFRRNLYKINTAPEYIYVFVDPTGGGKSDFGITAVFFEHGDMVV